MSNYSILREPKQVILKKKHNKKKSETSFLFISTQYHCYPHQPPRDINLELITVIVKLKLDT